MEPSIPQGSLVWLWPHPPAVGEVVAIRPDVGDPWALSRVIAVGPTQIQWNGLQLIQDGSAIQSEDTGLWVSECGEHHPTTRRESLGGGSVRVIPGGATAQIALGPGEGFLLGDRRGIAEDSRQWGSISVDELEMSVPLVLFSIQFCKNGSTQFRGPQILW
jgi:hypothetical protein